MATRIRKQWLDLTYSSTGLTADDIKYSDTTSVKSAIDNLYSKISYRTLTITKSGTGSGTVTSDPSGIDCGSTCSYQFVFGTNVTLTATPDSGSLFSGWSGDVISSNSTVTITMDSNKSVISIFNTLYTLTVTKSGAGTGTVTSSPVGIDCGSTCSYQFVSGTNVTLIATSDSGSAFGGWSGDVVDTNTTTTVTMDSNKSVTATFNVLYTLTVTKSGTGVGVVTSNPSGINCGAVCSYQFVAGTSVTLTATPDSSSIFNGWSGDVVDTHTTTTLTMDSNKSVTATFNALYTLTVTKSGTGVGTVTSDPSGINCGATCTYQFVSGTNVTLTATPDSGSAFVGWSGDVTGSSSTTIIMMSSNKSVTAIFNALYTLTVTKSGTGTGTVSSNPSGINCGTTCTYQFASGTNVTLTATPDSGSAFVGWSGDVVSTNTTTTVTMNSDKNVTATFNVLYTLTVTKSGTGVGAVTSNPAGIDCGSTCTYQFASGTNVTLTATPDSSFVFGGWSGDVTGSSSTITFIMNSDKNVTATFNILYTLTVTKSGSGTGTVSSNPSGIDCGSTCTYQFASGTNVTLTATPDSSSIFGGWSGDATDTNTVTTIIINSDKSVTATFNALYTLTVTKSGTGVGTITSDPSGINCGAVCSYRFVAGTSVTLTATPDSSSIFNGWSGDVVDTHTTTTLTMDSNKSVTATFNALYTLTVTKSGTGVGTVTSDPSGINCGATCTYQFVSGTNVTLTATPDSGSAFVGWSGDVTGSSSTTIIMMSSNKSVTAIFNALYTLTVTKSGTGTGTVSSNPSGINCGTTCTYQFASGTNVTLTATPDSGSAFVGWSGDVVSTNTTTTVTMNSDKNVTATFNVLYTLTVTKSGTGVGAVTSNPAGIDCGSTCTYQFASGTNVTLTATPDSSSIFGGWSGDATDTNTVTTIIINSDKSVTATFNPAYTLIVTKSGTGTGTVISNPSGINCGSTCSYQFAHNISITLTATPDSSSIFGGWSGDITDTNTTVTVTMSANKNVTVTFNIDTSAGYFTSGWSTSGNQSFIDKLLFSNETRTTLTATLSRSIGAQSACNSSIAGYFAGGNQSFIDKLLFSDETKSTLTAILSQSVYSHSACNSTLAGYFAGGWNNHYQSFIDKLLFSNETISILTATLSRSVYSQSACNSSLAGYFAGGVYNDYQSFIDKLLFSNDSRSTLTAILSQSVYAQSACNSTLAGYFAGGYYYNNGSNYYSFIDKLLFSDDSRSTLSTILSRSVDYQSACNSISAGYFAGGYGFNNDNNNDVYYSFIDKLLFSDDSRSTLLTTLSRSVYSQVACQSGGIL
jgi:uncharacterized protein (DUF2345 family)